MAGSGSLSRTRTPWPAPTLGEDGLLGDFSCGLGASHQTGWSTAIRSAGRRHESAQEPFPPADCPGEKETMTR